MPTDLTRHYTTLANTVSDEQIYLERYRECTLIQPTWFMSRVWFLQVGGGVHGSVGKRVGKSIGRAVDDVREVAMTEYCHIRIDIGVVPGSIVTPHYDPILSKIIAYSPTSREAAIRGLGMALDLVPNLR
jgi:hypothetical protein